MKTKIALLSLLAAFTFFSCAETEDPLNTEKPIAPYDTPVDMNDDGVVDCKIVYNTTMINNLPADMNGFVLSVNGTEFLTDTSANQIAFLFPPDAVSVTATAPNVFTGESQTIIRKDKQDDAYWQVKSFMNMNPIYIGLKFQNNGVWNVGWIKVRFDLLSGEPTVLAKKTGVDLCQLD